MSVQISFISKPLKALLSLSTLKKFRGMLTRERNAHIFSPLSISTPENWNILKFSNDVAKGVCSQCQGGASETQQIQEVSVLAHNPSCTLYRFHYWESVDGMYTDIPSIPSWSQLACSQTYQPHAMSC